MGMIRFSNKLAYTFIAMGILAILAVGINAVAPNPGHDASELDLAPFYITANDAGVKSPSTIDAVFAVDTTYYCF